MSTKFQDMIVAAENVINTYNESPGVEKIDVETFKAGLTKLGGTSEKALKEIELSDLIGPEAEELLGLKLPRLVAKQLVKIFQQEEAKDGATKARRITKFNAHDATAEELAAVYNPRRPTTPAAEEMKKRSKDQPFVVFDEQGGVHRRLTTQLLKELENGDEPREDIDLNGQPVPVYRIGELPPETVDEHPLYEGEPLRADGTCRLNLNWRDGISLKVRQLVHLAVNRTDEISIRDNDHVHDIHDMMKGEDAFAKVSGRYREAHKLYLRLQAEGKLPPLKVAKRNGGSRKGNDPFHQRGSHRTY